MVNIIKMINDLNYWNAELSCRQIAFDTGTTI